MIASQFVKKEILSGASGERQSLVYLGFSFCLHSDTISQGFTAWFAIDRVHDNNPRMD
jgi:hypothetical protein